MIQIPGESKKHSVPNNSDLFGTLHYTKNINLDEEGYLKLSPRTISIVNEGDAEELGLPLAFGRNLGGSRAANFNVVTSSEPFTLNLSPIALTATEDDGTSNPSFSFDSHGRWYRNLWTVADGDTDVLTKASVSSGAAYTDRSITLSDNVPHPIEVFRNRDTICIGDGNVVKQFDNSYSADTNLTLPTDYEVIGLAYSNYLMGILTQLSDSAAGQNQETFFFTWDGADAEAGQGIGIGSDRGFALTAYKGSWVVLTSAGQLLFFTGGGWQELASLPYYYQKILCGSAVDTDMFGDLMSVDGDIIYFNFHGKMDTYGELLERYLPSNPGGVLCYDPKIGIYHRYSHSLSPATMLSVSQANVDIATDVFTTSGTIPDTGNPVKYMVSQTPIGGLKVSKVYYVIKHSSTTFSVALTKEDALNAQKVDITSTGATTNYFLALDVLDYGATLVDQTGAVAQMGRNNGMSDSLILGATILRADSATTNYDHIELVADTFESRGYFVTPKITSENIEDNLEKVVVSYRTLKEGDKIIIKYQDEDILGLPVSTPQDTGLNNTLSNSCSWTDADTLTTTADISAAKTAFDNGKTLECEIISGAGAGTLVKITNITESSGTYTLTLEEEVDGASSGRFCNILIENWKKIGEITSTDKKGYKEFNVGRNSGWYRLKVELRGVNTSVRLTKGKNKTHKPN